MKLAELLAGLSTDEIERIAHEDLRSDEQLPRATLLNMIEGVLRSYRFVQELVGNRQPPTFAMLTLLLDAPGYALPTTGFQELVLAETHRIAELVNRREILDRDDQLRLYRRVLYEARRNDLILDASESAILGVLRRELGVAQVEHFLIEHHTELQEFWRQDRCFLNELTPLRSAGLLFVRDGATVLADDVAPTVRRVLGIDMPRTDARRLFTHLSNQDLQDALASIQAKTSGAKEEKIERLSTHMVQPRAILGAMSLAALKDICRDSGASVSGSKEDLVERVIEHFASKRDQRTDSPPPPPIVEDRRLGEPSFRRLFASLRGQQLSDILRAFPELRQSGSKDVRVSTLWSARRSEDTLLGELVGRDLEAILTRLGLRASGSKKDRIDRLVEYFANVDPQELRDDHSAASANDQSEPEAELVSD